MERVSEGQGCTASQECPDGQVCAVARGSHYVLMKGEKVEHRIN
jgi:hypothetical protein